MNTKNTLSITEARKKIFKIADEVQKGSNYYTLTEKGKPKAVIMSADEFDSWQETMEIMNDPELMKDIKEAKKDIKSGEYKNYSTLEEVLAEQGFVLADKGKKKYVSSDTKKNGAKKSKKSR